MVRPIKIALILSVALWGLLGALGNLTDWGDTVGAVAATTSMSTFDGGADSWRATTSPLIITLGAALIPIFKLLSAGFCLLGAGRMWTARTAPDSAAFDEAKKPALACCYLAVLMLFAGWIVIAETWFELWRSDVFDDAVLSAAFRYAGFVGLIALFVGSRDD